MLLAAIAVRTQQDPVVALRAQDQAGTSLHTQLGDKPKVRDGIASVQHCSCTAFIGTV
jgi:hypothetical protein